MNVLGILNVRTRYLEGFLNIVLIGQRQINWKLDVEPQY